MKKFFAMVHKVIKNADIVLEVLDARFIDETRNEQLEREIERTKKQIIYVINKVDLVKSAALKKKISDLHPRIEMSAKEHLGTKKLRDLIKRYAKENAVTFVGVVGYPNTGKSSVINVLVGRAAAKAAPKSGQTRGYQFVKLTENILLIDSPGVYPVEENSDNIIVSAVDFNKVKDPDYYVEILFEKFPGALEKHYGIEDLEDFAEKRNFLKKGGKPDIFRAAREILKDWQHGKITV